MARATLVAYTGDVFDVTDVPLCIRFVDVELDGSRKGDDVVLNSGVHVFETWDWD